MIAREFSNFFKPYFLNEDLSVTPVTEGTYLQAETCRYVFEFDWSRISDLPLLQLMGQHVQALPQDLVFIGPGADADLLERYMPRVFDYFGRKDITFRKPDQDITEDFVEIGSRRYFACHAFQTHMLYTARRLLAQGRPVGRLGPFPTFVEKHPAEWSASIESITVPFYLLGQEYPDQVVPNFTFPMARTFVNDLRLPECRFAGIDQVGPGVLMLLLMRRVGAVAIGDNLDYSTSDGDDYNWYKGLLNRNWHPSYRCGLGHFR